MSHPWRAAAAATAAVLARGPAGPLASLAGVGTLSCAAFWSVSTVTQLWTLVVLPAGATVLGVLLWVALEPGWRGLAVRPTGTARPLLCALAAGMLLSAGATAVVLWTLAALSPGATRLGPAVVVAQATGVMLTALTLALTVRRGTSAALSTGIVGTVVGILVGGTPLLDRLWWAVPWCWAALPPGDRALTVTAVDAALLAGAAVLAVGGGRRAAARGED